jgi:hypothetical protein
LIKKHIIYNIGEEVIAQHNCTVKIPHAEPGYTRLNNGGKGKQECKRGSRQKTRTNNK